IKMAVLFGNIQIFTQAMLALMENGCDIALMTQNGHFRGRVASAYSKNITSRLQQFNKYNNSEFKLKFAKNIICSKIKNGIVLLKKYHYNQHNPVRIKSIDSLTDMLEQVKKSNDMDSLRGYEGYASKLYFHEFAKCITVPEMKFTGRTFFPSPDPVNALLSFGYSFIARELQAILDAYGLDPYIGFVHTIKYGRASLSLDILEEFRHCVVDRLVLRLINKKILTKDDFYKNEEKNQCYLKKESLNIFIHHYERMANSENISYPPKNQSVSYRKIFWDQIEKLKKTIMDNEPYVPYLFGEN
ncbi:CRISPR-associated endonuclease Cas1, partial [bacterium]|nr:CRISPR-associated endonuclease Cas1 [bacterium]